MHKFEKQTQTSDTLERLNAPPVAVPKEEGVHTHPYVSCELMDAARHCSRTKGVVTNAGFELPESRPQGLENSPQRKPQNVETSWVPTAAQVSQQQRRAVLLTTAEDIS